MEEQEEDPKEKPVSGKAFDKAADALNWWNMLATINEDDPAVVGFFKILIRIVGIIVLLALSPLILLGILFAFAAAM